MVAIVTHNEIVQRGFGKDRDGLHLLNALSQDKVGAQFVAWDDSSVDWGRYRVAVISSTWNYQAMPTKYLEWLSLLKDHSCHVINPVEMIYWNMNKGYLLEVKNAGINIPTTHLLQSIEELESYGNRIKSLVDGIVIKPVVSASAYGTFLINDFSDGWADRYWTGHQVAVPMLAQPFIHSIKTKGERSIVFIDGHLTHAKLKFPRSGDFRVQKEFGGTLRDYAPSIGEIEFATEVLNTFVQLFTMPTYARVDFCEDNHGQLALMELELIEPELWLDENPLAADLMVRAIKRLL